jgi:hypothetical protein
MLSHTRETCASTDLTHRPGKQDLEIILDGDGVPPSVLVSLLRFEAIPFTED